eukprot:TRINITY_DN1503_c0_g3_i2.p1 TRINITY_DN1503_c0_g3~~TRINITY_DN1503_c0_g3_i2.p1  ORF type:complete len:700 (-),score=209.77 TRINITY_DN1503_c0_g3_i2:833-2932(-)
MQSDGSFDTELEFLKQVGFTNEQLIKHALRLHEGSRNKALRWLRDNEDTVLPLEVAQMDLPQLIRAIISADPDSKIDYIRQVRKLLSIDVNPPIQEVVDSGVVPQLIRFLDHPSLQFELLWVLTNIASGTTEHVALLLQHDLVPRLVRLLSSAADDVKEQAAWLVGNIAGDSCAHRDYVLEESGVLQPLLEFLCATEQIRAIRNATWAISNLCRGKPRPVMSTVAPAIPTLASLIYSTDEETVGDALWALSYLSDGPNENIQRVLQSGVCRRVAELLTHQSTPVVLPALRIAGNIVTGDHLQTQAMINCGCLSSIPALMSHAKVNVQKEACWLVSNVMAGTKDQIQCVLEHNIVPLVVAKLQHSDTDSRIKKEALYVLANACSGGTPAQLQFMINQACIPAMCAMLPCTEPRLVLVALEGLQYLLKAHPTKGAEDVEECGGLDHLEQLQCHDSEEIYKNAAAMLEAFFCGGEEEDEAPELAFAAPAPFSFNFKAEAEEEVEEEEEEASWLTSEQEQAAPTQMTQMRDEYMEILASNRVADLSKEKKEKTKKPAKKPPAKKKKKKEKKEPKEKKEKQPKKPVGSLASTPIQHTMLPEDTPEHLHCPISCMVFHDPVLAMDGFSYERQHIEDWLLKHDSSPMTGDTLLNKMVVPNQALRQELQALSEGELVFVEPNQPSTPSRSSSWDATAFEEVEGSFSF